MFHVKHSGRGEMQYGYRRDAWWGPGHYVVTQGGRTLGRVSKSDDGKWSAYPEPIHPAAGRPLPPAVAKGLSTRRDAAILLDTVSRETVKET
jgi:hypothetical protein